MASKEIIFLKELGVFSVISFFILVLMFPHAASARMAGMGDEELSSITGQSGVSIAIDEGSARYTFDTWYIADTDHVNLVSGFYDTWATIDPDENNRIEFNNLVVDDGAGGNFSFATPAGQPITFDVGTNPYKAGQTVISMALPQNTNPRYISVGNFVFCRQDIGSLAINHMTETERHLIIGPHGGIDFEYATKMDIDSLEYKYNSTPGGSLLLSNIHLSQIAQGAPETPAAWTFSGPFRIGNLAQNNPATIDVGTSAEEAGKTVLRLNAPMQGSLRVGNVSFGVNELGVANNFGPCALDGINVHRMSIQLVPGN